MTTEAQLKELLTSAEERLQTHPVRERESEETSMGTGSSYQRVPESGATLSIDGTGGDTGSINGDWSCAARSTTSSGAGGKRQFISYVTVHPSEGEEDPDGLEQKKRMDLEEEAIKLILTKEPLLIRTPPNNRGFDLWEQDENCQPSRWVEVKAMSGTLTDRPVGMSSEQFKCAQKKGSAYWLYVVEKTGTDTARIVRIQDPAGQAKTFTFDHGWLNVAHVNNNREDGED